MRFEMAEMFPRKLSSHLLEEDGTSSNRLVMASGNVFAETFVTPLPQQRNPPFNLIFRKGR